MSHELLDALVGKPCWHVSAGGRTAPSFVLVLGGRVPRDLPLKNPAQPEAFRNSRGEVELLVWSAWRLQRGPRVLATSDQKGLAQRLILFLLGNEAQTYFTQETSEYPLVAGIEPNADLIPLDTIVQPEIDLSDLDDLQTTLEMIEASGALD